MAKRFTDSAKWAKPFMRGLSARHKLLWLYLCDACDHAGVWDVEIDVAGLRIGEPVDAAAALAAFGEHVVPVDGGTKWFIPAFIAFQYGQLNPANRAHQSAILRLQKIGVAIDSLNKSEHQKKPLTSPLQGDKDKELDKDKDPDLDKEVGVQREGKHRPDDLTLDDLPESIRTATMLTAWGEWAADRRARGKKLTPLAVARQLAKLAEWGEARAVAAIDASIEAGWTGLFEPSAGRGAAPRRDSYGSKGNLPSMDDLLAKNQAARDAARGEQHGGDDDDER